MMKSDEKNSVYRVPRLIMEESIDVKETSVERLNPTMETREQINVPWLPASVVVTSEHEHNVQTYILENSSDSNSGGIFVQIPYQIVSEESNHPHIHSSLVCSEESMIHENESERDGGMKFRSKFGDPMCSLSMFGLDPSSFGDKLEPSTEQLDPSEQAFDNNEAENYNSDSCSENKDKTSISGYCSMCENYIKDSAEMEKHLIYHQERNLAMTSTDMTCIDFSSVQRICPQCGNTLRELDSFSQQEFHSEYQTIDPLTNIPMFTCDSCGKDYTLGISQDVSASEAEAIAAAQHAASYGASVNSGYANYGSELQMGRICNSHTNLNQSAVNNRFPCTECVKTYKHNRDLRKHIRTRHAGSEAYANVSMKTGRNISTVNGGLSSESGMKCETNDSSATHFEHDISSNSLNTFTQGVNSVSQTQNSAKLVCDLCRKYFRGPFELRRHIKTVHENNRPFKCQSCEKSFRDAHELRRHNAGHQKPIFHYQSQPPTLVTSEGLATGSNSMSGVKYAYAKREDSSTHHSSVSRGGDNSHIIHMSSGGGLDHSIATGVMFNDPYSMSDGTMYGDEETVSMLEQISSNTDSTIMEKGRPHSLSVSTPGNDFYCRVCEKNFRGANEFKRHYSVVHEKKYRYKCIHCGKLWRDQYDLKRHCKRSHFLDQDIDKAFIKQCLLTHNSNSSTVNASTTSLQLPNRTSSSLNVGLDLDSTSSHRQHSSQNIMRVSGDQNHHQRNTMLIHDSDSLSDSVAGNLYVVSSGDLGCYMSSNLIQRDMEDSSHQYLVENPSSNMMFACDFSGNDNRSTAVVSDQATCHVSSSSSPSIKTNTDKSSSIQNNHWNDLVNDEEVE